MCSFNRLTSLTLWNFSILCIDINIPRFADYIGHGNHRRNGMELNLVGFVLKSYFKIMGMCLYFVSVCKKGVSKYRTKGTVMKIKLTRLPCVHGICVADETRQTSTKN